MGLSSFVKTDVALLRDEFTVIEFHYKRSKTWSGKTWMMISAFIHACRYMPRAQKMYSFFAGFHCFAHLLVAKVLRKPTLIMAGGFDTASIPSLQYGVFYKKNLLQLCVRMEYKLADAIGVVDKSLLHCKNTYADTRGIGFETGLLAFMPSLSSKVSVVEGGADTAFWQLPSEETTREGVLFVAVISQLPTLHAKGGDLLLEIAAMHPDISFTFVGLTVFVMREIKKRNLQNVVLLPSLGWEELRTLYQHHKVLALPSYSEGLPNVLCEAMLCGCIPLVSHVNGMPAAVGDAGYVLDRPEVDSWTTALKAALLAPAEDGLRARQRIVDGYSLMQRKTKLTRFVSQAK
jgi:glycosyltransferase involved in cell wall biosynthesis